MCMCVCAQVQGPVVTPLLVSETFSVHLQEEVEGSFLSGEFICCGSHLEAKVLVGQDFLCNF